MVGYVTNIEEDTLENEDYRRVLFTGKNLQLVLMTVQPGEEIGLETHEEHDQFIRIEAGTGVAWAATLFEIVMGVAGFLICLTLVMIVLLAADSLFTRKGSFSGAGAEIVWPMPSR